jgi:hypothetical protein
MNKQFEEWYLSQPDYYTITDVDYTYETIQRFKNLHFSMQWGVYLEFFDSVGIRINAGYQWFRIFKQGETPYFEDKFKSRIEAQQMAIKKAFELLNKQKL